MKKILVVYYTQTGQQKRILDSLLQPLLSSREIEVDYCKLEMEKKFPFPWGKEFYECFPESVKGIPANLEPISIDSSKKYDLIFLGYQPWYLSPSIPMSSFLQSDDARKLLKNSKVITVIGARNMWTKAQGIVKAHLSNLHAQLVGNIVLTDRSDNYIAGITVIRWLVSGNKGPSALLPEAGVSEKDIQHATVFGDIILAKLLSNKLETLQDELVERDAVPVKYHLVNIEKNARKIFDIFANYILRKGGAGEQNRGGRIKVFKIYLLFVFFILSPIFSLIFMLKRWVLFRIANREIAYLKSTKF